MKNPEAIPAVAAVPAVPALAQAARRLALLGGESSGKTTLAQALAGQLGTSWVPEYGRQRWEELRETLGVAELLQVAQRQVALEEEAAAGRYLFENFTALGGEAAPL